MSDLLLYAAPLYLVLIGLEALATRHGRGGGYDVRDTAASMALSLSNLAMVTLTQGVTFALYLGVHEYALFEIPATLAIVPLALIVQDFTIYWLHRAYHAIRILWAVHVVHHSSRYLNLGTALRLSALEPFVDPLFFIPMVLVGFDPTLLLTASAINQLYGFFLHTELVRRLGPLEHVLVTPSHHRVHHGCNPRYLNRNFGILFITWDRLFGTFQPEDEPVAYGLTDDVRSYNPLTITFHEWRALARDVRHAPTWAQRLARCFRFPELEPQRLRRGKGIGHSCAEPAPDALPSQRR